MFRATSGSIGILPLIMSDIIATLGLPACALNGGPKTPPGLITVSYIVSFPVISHAARSANVLLFE